MRQNKGVMRKMGRKRTSKKKKVLVSVDIDIYEKLVDLGKNRSVLFTDAALEYIEKVAKNENKENNSKI